MSSNAIPKVALVTGAGKRIGRAIALALAESGWDVALHCRDSVDETEEVARSVREMDRRAIVLKADLADEAAVSELVPRATAALGPAGCLVNNASVFEYDAALTADRAGWDRHMETNLRAPMVLTQQFARLLPAAAHGLAVNIIDQRVWNLTPHFTSYTLSKAGLWTLTQIMAMALAPRIRVNAIGPGPTLPSPRQTQAQFAKQSAQLPLQHGASAEEIAAAVLFLLQAGSMTGQMIALDGGQHLGWAQGPNTLPEE
jgi:NAD(P)-dependent dehydrogenase (short-subunit alcohol dehydrogenase family)